MDMYQLLHKNRFFLLKFYYSSLLLILTLAARGILIRAEYCLHCRLIIILRARAVLLRAQQLLNYVVYVVVKIIPEQSASPYVYIVVNK